jgi:hypothetical protein
MLLMANIKPRLLPSLPARAIIAHLPLLAFHLPHPHPNPPLEGRKYFITFATPHPLPLPSGERGRVREIKCLPSLKKTGVNKLTPILILAILGHLMAQS